MAVEKVVIIGSGPAGWTAAVYAARASLQPLVYEGVVPLGQLNLTTEVENFPSWPYADSEALAQFSKSALPPERYDYVAHHYEGRRAHQGRRAPTGPEMMQWCRQQAVNFGTRIVTDNIARVDFSVRPFALYPAAGGEPVRTRTVILATGADANYLGLPSEDRFKNNGVSACAVCDGALPRFRNRPLVVVGGGDTAVEEATYLTKFASTVYLVHRRDSLRASAVMAERAKSNPKISIKWNRQLDEVLGNDEDGVTGARLKSTTDGSTETLELGGVFLGIGHTPNTKFLAGQVELHPNGYIKWTRPARTHTSVDGVFAAGDVADDYYRQAITAAGSGCMAALDAERWLAEHGEH
jgi:thioredoxin reductase (NADPH)